MTGRAGDNVKLPCDVDDQDAFVSWSKDGESITIAWPRFKVSATSLSNYLSDDLEGLSLSSLCHWLSPVLHFLDPLLLAILSNYWLFLNFFKINLAL